MELMLDNNIVLDHIQRALLRAVAARVPARHCGRSEHLHQREHADGFVLFAAEGLRK